MACTTKNIYDSLEYCRGNLIVPGVYPKAYWISKSDLTTIPAWTAYAATGVTMAQMGQLSGNFVAAADKYWHSIDLLDNASDIKSESQGEEPSKTFTNTVTLKTPLTNDAAVGLCRQLNQDDIIVVVQQRTGDFKVLGNEMFHTEVKPSMESGAGITDTVGTTLEISCYDIGPAPVYTGTLALAAKTTLSCSDGKITTTT